MITVPTEVRPLIEVWGEFNDSIITGRFISPEDAQLSSLRVDQFIIDDRQESRAELLICELICAALKEGHPGFKITAMGLNPTRLLITDRGDGSSIGTEVLDVMVGVGSWLTIRGEERLKAEFPEVTQFLTLVNANPDRFIPRDVQDRLTKRSYPAASPAEPKEPEFKLSDEQQGVVDEIVEKAKAGEGGVYFLTGKAGTGKSTVSREIIKELSGSIVVTAPTGIAAVNVGGQTLHSFFKLSTDFTQLAKREKLSALKETLEKTKLILVDEVSMVRADVLDAVDVRLRETLEIDEPFGGKLMLFVGDNWQLEPVLGPQEKDMFYDRGYASTFWFDAKVFDSSKSLFPCQIHATELTVVFRQKGDDQFLDALNAARKGNGIGLPVFNSKAGYPDPGADAIKICFANWKVDEINSRMLSNVKSTPKSYFAEITGRWTEHPADSELVLKVGAKVMVIKNVRDDQHQLVANGTVGTVTSLSDESVSVRLDDGREITLTRDVWEQLEYEVNSLGEIGASVAGEFKQIPLRLAYAITAHKSQGQTYARCHLVLEGPSFSHGQTYVALSRCKSLQGLTLERRISPSDLLVDHRVVNWDRNRFGSKVVVA